MTVQINEPRTSVLGAYVQGTREERAPWLVRYIRRAAERFHLDVAVGEGDIRLIDAAGKGYGQATLHEAAFIIDFARRRRAGVYGWLELGHACLVWQRYFLFKRLPRFRRLRYDASLRS